MQLTQTANQVRLVLTKEASRDQGSRNCRCNAARVKGTSRSRCKKPVRDRSWTPRCAALEDLPGIPPIVLRRQMLQCYQAFHFQQPGEVVPELKVKLLASLNNGVREFEIGTAPIRSQCTLKPETQPFDRRSQRFDTHKQNTTVMQDS